MTRKKNNNITASPQPAARNSPQNQQVTSPARQPRNNQQQQQPSTPPTNGVKKQQYHLTEEQIDAQLKTIGLIRKAIPKDGACLFRATAEQLLANQNYHMEVRRSCVTFLRKHQPDFEPFVCCDGIPYDHYLYEMGKPDCWAGQVELQALSLHYKVNFIIYSDQPKPTIIDNGFKKNVTLCFLGGNHYDCVYEEKKMALLTAAQEIVYSMISAAVGDKPTPTSEYEYKNVGLLSYLNNLLVQRERDKKLAEGMQEVSHTDLSGFYKKDDGKTPGWEKKLSRRTKKEQSKKELKKGIPLDLEILLPEDRKDKEKEKQQLKQDLERIAQMEKAQEKLLAPEAFPVLGISKPAVPKEEPPKEEKPSEEKKEVVWGNPTTNWKSLFTPPPQPVQPTPPPAAKQPAKAKRSKKAKNKKANESKTKSVPISPVTIINNDAQLGNVNITFGSITPSSPSPSRVMPPLESNSDKASQQQESASSTPTPSATTKSESTQQKEIEKESITAHYLDDLDLDPELRSLSIVFGSLPASSLSETDTSPFVTLRLSKHKTKITTKAKETNDPSPSVEEQPQPPEQSDQSQHMNGYQDTHKEKIEDHPEDAKSTNDKGHPKPYQPHPHHGPYDPQQYAYVPQYMPYAVPPGYVIPYPPPGPGYYTEYHHPAEMYYQPYVYAYPPPYPLSPPRPGMEPVAGWPQPGAWVPAGTTSSPPPRRAPQ